MRYALLLLAVVLGFASVTARADDTAVPATTAKTFSNQERAGIEAIVKDYLTKEHPEIIMQAAQEMQKRDMASAETKSEQGIAKNRDKIYNNPDTPIGGDPKGDVTVVEFYDYQCGYCKMSEPVIEKLLKEDKKVRFLYKNYPILGAASVEAAKAAFASMRQGKFVKFHEALMSKKDHLSDDLLYQTAKEAGLDVDKLKKDMADPAIQKMIDEDVNLGQDIGVRGTPMFIVGDQVYPGAMQYDQLKKAVDDERAGAKKKS